MHGRIFFLVAIPECRRAVRARRRAGRLLWSSSPPAAAGCRRLAHVAAPRRCRDLPHPPPAVLYSPPPAERSQSSNSGLVSHSSSCAGCKAWTLALAAKAQLRHRWAAFEARLRCRLVHALQYQAAPACVRATNASCRPMRPRLQGVTGKLLTVMTSAPTAM